MLLGHPINFIESKHKLTLYNLNFILHIILEYITCKIKKKWKRLNYQFLKINSSEVSQLEKVIPFQIESMVLLI